MAENGSGKLKREADWRHLFPEELIRQAEAELKKTHVEMRESWNSRTIEFGSGRNGCVTRIYRIPRDYSDDWRMDSFSCSCRSTRACVHMPMALLYLEKKQGGRFIVEESDYDYRRRMEREKVAALFRERAEEDAKAGLEPIPALEAFPGRPWAKGGILYFDFDALLQQRTTTRAAIARMQEARKAYHSYSNSGARLCTSREGEMWIEMDMDFHHSLYDENVQGSISREDLYVGHRRNDHDREDIYHSVGEWSLGEDGRDEEAEPLDACELIAIEDAVRAAVEYGQKSVTDKKAEDFFRFIRTAREASAQKEIRTVEAKAEKTANVELTPRVVVNDGDPVLSFKIGTAGNKPYIVKDCYALIDAVNGEKDYVLGKKETLHFSGQAFSEGSGKLFDFIQRHRVQSYQGTYQVDLKGARLDNFYDMYEGGSLELLDKTNQIKDELVNVGHMDIHFRLTAERLADALGNFIGVEVTGFVPILIKGNSGRYVLDRNGLSRVSREEISVLEPFLSVSDAAGYFRFQVGKDRLQEFYYRVLPGLLDNPFVEFVDNAAEEAAAYLPPDAAFTFFLDLEGNVLSCRAEAAYGERVYTLGFDAAQEKRKKNEYHDEEQEKRVEDAIRRWMPAYNGGKQAFEKKVTDDELYDFLTVGLASLEYYGTVRGTSAFSSHRVVQEPAVSVGISVGDGGLLNIGLTSKDVSMKELAAIFNSYTLKKRFYRLKSGDFVDLTGDRQFGELTRFLSQMDLTPMEVIREKIQLPIYRALYLDRMLEAHDRIASTRDRTYRALIRGFKTVRDAEYEAPACMEEVLRPYQTYGFKWLKTLQAAGFGGILADEMGLGKTLQMISIFQADMEEAEGREKKERKRAKDERQAERAASLVVCPASLVYNWQEEIARFAPDLKSVVLAGTAGARKKALQEKADVFITSYDLLKRDIALYENRRFANCVLDEAQYIKNAKSAAAKSVKLIQADHRFALTGTPIENRLSELWSIFDFLMPGFLYGQAEFERRFELPITKQKDEAATEKLKAMTGPFILRRKKEDVLQDLPAKMEEVRYARLTGEQQKIYDAQVARMKGMLDGGELGGEEKIKMFAELTRIRQICCDPSLVLEEYAGESAKRAACLDLVQSAIEGGHRMLIFSQFVTMLELLEKDLSAAGIPYFKIVGATPKEKRIQLVRSFNEGDVPVFLISLKAGGTGLNLTGADFVIHYDPWWNLAAQNQATDRAHRIGQTKQVTVFKLILKDTIEERIMELQNAKKDLAEAILEGESQSLLSLSAEELLGLLG